MEHEQVDLPELGFTVDVGLEELIRACWRRGIATFGCCINMGGGRGGYLGFDDPRAALRFAELTGATIRWIDDEEVATDAEVYFTRKQLAMFVELLKFDDE